MKKILSIVVVSVFALIASAFTIQAVINWKIDNEKAQVKFSLQAHGQEVMGNFKGVKGDVKFDANDLDHSSFNCTIDITTINTGVDGRDKHLQAKDFFDAATYPVSTFTSTKIEKTTDGYLATGTLSMRGITKEVAIPFAFDGTADAGTFKGWFVIKRSDYTIGKASAEVGDDVTINLDIPVSKAE